jgi:hypothetical protein
MPGDWTASHRLTGGRPRLLRWQFEFESFHDGKRAGSSDRGNQVAVVYRRMFGNLCEPSLLQETEGSERHHPVAPVLGEDSLGGGETAALFDDVDPDLGGARLGR